MNYQQTVTSNTGVLKIGKKVSDELPKVKDKSFNLRDRVNDMLLTEKYNLVNYQITVNEIIDQQLLAVLKNNSSHLQDLHGQFFAELFNLGEYQANVAQYPEIADLNEVFTNYKNQLPFH